MSVSDQRVGTIIKALNTSDGKLGGYQASIESLIDYSSLTMGECKVLGSLDNEGRLHPLSKPLAVNSYVFLATENEVARIFHFNDAMNGLYIGS